MKTFLMKTFITMSLFAISYNLASQELPVLSTTSLYNVEQRFDHPENGNYAKDTHNERDQYVGPWEYSQNGILFQLKIEKMDQVINKIEVPGFETRYNYSDQLTLRYRLIKNNILLFDNLEGSDVDPIANYAIKLSSYNFADGRIWDYTRNVRGSHTITRLNTNPPKIIFNLERFDYTKLNDSSFYQDGQPLFSIPQNGIEMVKID
ncbi:DUF6705 family protein [Flavobacterium microcysteis]|uniref:DUF6705 domain-containing protein n=1 Tax=Flavobacterium microcysteis TaxID=2596891 RepID=A0A501QNB5_9FLAO|nr:DUF6705 family protein [Flavobacterium microcysteis]TPD73596.1 hypothetical protein FJA49_00775 [Flavobacterium microcysteis]